MNPASISVKEGLFSSIQHTLRNNILHESISSQNRLIELESRTQLTQPQRSSLHEN